MINEMKMKEQLEEVLLIMAEKGLIPYKDGNAWCILLGENIQEGICGFGYTIIDAMMDFYKEATAEGIIRKEEQKSVKDKIIEDTISYLNGGMCFYNSVEELKYRSNLAYRLKSLRPSWKPSEEWSDYKDKVNIPYCSSEPEWSEEEAKKAAEDYADEFPGMTHENDGSTIEDYDKPYNDFLAGVLWAKHHGIFQNGNTHWKPSKEQMSSLKRIVYNRPLGSIDFDNLESLYNDLKKL